jgi:hypothetical protein
VGACVPLGRRSTRSKVGHCNHPANLGLPRMWNTRNKGPAIFFLGVVHYDVTVTGSIIGCILMRGITLAFYQREWKRANALKDIKSASAQQENNQCDRKKEKRRSRKQLSVPPGWEESQIPICTTTHSSPQSIMAVAADATTSLASWALHLRHGVSSTRAYGSHPRACTPSYRRGTLYRLRPLASCGKRGHAVASCLSDICSQVNTCIRARCEQ